MRKRHRQTNWATAAIAASALFAWNPAATADTLASTFVTNTNQVHDVSGEDYIPGIGNTSGGTQIQVGDTFLAVLDIEANNSKPATSYGIGSANPQLTGIFAVQVTSVTTATPNTTSNGNTNVSAVNLTFAAANVQTAIAACNAIGTACNGGTPLVLTAAAAAAMTAHSDANTFGFIFSDPLDALASGTAYVNSACTPGAFPNCSTSNPSQANIINQVTAGNLEFTVDIAAGNIFGENNVPLRPADVTAGAPGTNIGGAENGSNISLFYQNTADLGRTFSPTVTVAGNLVVPQPNTIYGINDSYTFTLFANAVPEPGSLGMLGSGLVCLGGILAWRRRQQNQA